MQSTKDEKITNPFEIYKKLPQTNCGECSLPNCLAFAAAVIKGNKQLNLCPYIKADDLVELTMRIGSGRISTGSGVRTLKF